MTQTTEKLITLSNGLRIAYKYVPYTRIVHCGYIIDNGGRDDREGEAGMAHFIEHLIFKGTQKRKTFHILNYLESVGGDMNAYTTKEKTCVYASLGAEHFERAVDVLTDILFFSTLPEKEIQKERQVIMEEIDMYRDAPDEAIFEDYDLLLFPHHAMGLPILGTKETLSKIQKSHISRHMQQNFTADSIVLSIVGNVTEKEVMKMADKYLSHLQLSQGTTQRVKPHPIQVAHQKVLIPTHQAHEIIGGEAISLKDDTYATFVLLNNILGGPAMNTRLSLNIREKHGLTYNISSFYAPFTDCGIWGIYYACEHSSLKRVRKMVLKELNDLREVKMGNLQLSQAKKQLAGQLMLGNENLSGQMLGMGKEVIDFGEIVNFEKYLADIERITAENVQDCAHQFFQIDTLSTLTYEPQEDTNG